MGTNRSKRSTEPLGGNGKTDARESSVRSEDLSSRQKKRGWREIEAWRERKFLRESLAEIWDDELLIDESMFSGDDSDVAFYTDSDDTEAGEEIPDFEDEAFYDDED